MLRVSAHTCASQISLSPCLAASVSLCVLQLGVAVLLSSQMLRNDLHVNQQYS